jgi:hypothetical protein
MAATVNKVAISGPFLARNPSNLILLEPLTFLSAFQKEFKNFDTPQVEPGPV